jgi:lauroyl/myristoyl acyltransferase
LYDWIGKAAAREKAHRRLATWTSVLPDAMVIAVLKLLGSLAFAFIRRKEAIARIERNMADVIGSGKAGGGRPDLHRINRSYLQNVMITLYEILIGVYRLPKLKAKGKLDRIFTAEGEERLENVLRRGKGAIVVTPHVGNFFYYYWYLSQKYDCLAVVTAESPELRPIYLKFQSLGCRGLDYDVVPPLQMMRSLRRHLAAGGVLFLLGDFYRPAFPQAAMFGRTTRSPEGAAALGIEQQAPVVPFYGRRDRGFRHRLVFGTPLLLHERYARSERREATNELNRFMESVILFVPAQWFYWFNADERWLQEEEAEGEKRYGHG